VTPPPSGQARQAARAPQRSSRAAGPQLVLRMTPELEAARTAFVDEARRETPGSDLPRYVAVLDALLAWSAERTDRLALQMTAKRRGLVRFVRAGTKDPFWSAQPTRTGAPTLEIHLPASRQSSAADRAETLQTLNAHSRVALVEGDRLRIGFGALKNAAALAAVLALMDRLLADAAAPADASA